MTTLAGGVLQKQENVRNKSGPIVFCKSYQRGFCVETGDHFGEFDGSIKFLRHICASCWLHRHKKAAHPENECPGVPAHEAE